MARTRKGLGRAAYAYWIKHGFDAKLKAELQWMEDEYATYEKQHHKKCMGADIGGKQPRKKILTKAARKVNSNLPAGIKSLIDLGLVQWHFMKSVTTRRAQNC